MTISMAVAASAGFLSFLSPCVLPLVPSYLAPGRSSTSTRTSTTATTATITIEQ